VTNTYFLSSAASAGFGYRDDRVIASPPIGLTDTQMRQQANFAGFDFDTVWEMPADGGYPGLKSNYNSTTPDPNPTTYTLTLNPNGGLVTPPSVAQAQGTTYTLPTPTRAGYEFKGWTLLGNGSLSGSTYTFGAGNATVTAHWEEITQPPPPPINTIPGTSYEATFFNWILYYVFFGWIWM